MKAFQDFPPEYMPIAIAILAIFVALFISLYFFYTLSLFNLLKAIKPENRRMKAGIVWLTMVSILELFFAFDELYGAELDQSLLLGLNGLFYLISIFNLVFQFYMVNKIADSIEAEFKSRSLSVEPRPTYQLGLMMCICALVSIVQKVPMLAFFAQIAGIAGFVIWIVYWIKITEWKNKIKFLPRQDNNDSSLFKDLY